MKHRLAIVVIALLASGGPSLVLAEQLRIETPTLNSTLKRPHRGMTMSAVEAKFGAPSKRAAAVGEPPITRWDYPSYAVFFESDRVIHTVVKRR